jgi:hypothetical protein
VKKNGELKRTKATPFAIGKLEGSRNYTRTHNSTLAKARQKIALAKAGELIGYVWTPNTYYEPLDAVETGIFF